MWVDMNTKPKQGTPFRVDRSMMMNVPEDYDDDIEKANTHPLLLPIPAEKQPFIRTFPTIDRPKPVNRRRSVLGSTDPKQTVGPIPLDRANKTKTLTPVTKTNPVSWADTVRGNPRQEQTVQEPIRDRYLDTIGRYANRLNRL